MSDSDLGDRVSFDVGMFAARKTFLLFPWPLAFVPDITYGVLIDNILLSLNYSLIRAFHPFAKLRTMFSINFPMSRLSACIKPLQSLIVTTQRKVLSMKYLPSVVIISIVNSRSHFQLRFLYQSIFSHPRASSLLRINLDPASRYLYLMHYKLVAQVLSIELTKTKGASC